MGPLARLIQIGILATVHYISNKNKPKPAPKTNTVESNNIRKVVEISKPSTNEASLISVPILPIANSWDEDLDDELFALYPYYPKNKYPYLTEEFEKVRKNIWAFKDGINSEQIANEIIYAIDNKWDIDRSAWNAKNTMISIIPASTKLKTEKRFKRFCDILSDKLNIFNGYYAIEMVNDRSEFKGIKGKDKTKDLKYDRELISGRYVILFDDITTTSESYVQNAQRLRENGAKGVIGIFLGETVFHDSTTHVK